MTKPDRAVRAYDKAHFLVYSNEIDPFGKNADAYCAAALDVGFDTARHYTEAELRKTQFWTDNAGILEEKRGAGYWLWKPYIILETLRQVGENDILVYADAGRYKPGSFAPFPSFPHALLQLTALTPQRFIHGFRNGWMRQVPNTKADCFALMDAETDEMFHAPQISAVPLAYMPGPAAFEFLSQWLSFATDPRILTDQPDCVAKTHEDFEDHRHDQAIASILIHRMRGHYLNMTKDGIFSVVNSNFQPHAGIYRPQTHAGYLSQLVEAALPEGFLDDPKNADISTCQHVVANLSPDEPVPYMPRAQSTQNLVDEFIEQLNMADPVFEPTQLKAILEKKRLSLLQLHAISQSTHDTAAFWDAFQSEVRNHAGRMRDEGVSVGHADAVQLTINALYAAQVSFPELRKHVLRFIAWSCFDWDTRQAWKGQFGSIKGARCQEALDKFCECVDRLNGLAPESEVKYNRRVFADAVTDEAAEFLNPA